MPYRNRRFNRRMNRRYNRARLRSYRRSQGGGLVNLAKGLAPLMGLNTERKIKDVSDTITPGTSLDFNLLNGIGQGTSSSTRVGTSIRATSLQIHQKLTLNSAATAATEIVCALVVDRQPNGLVFPEVAYVDNGFSSVSFRNHDFKQRFVTLRKWVVHLDPNSRTEAHRHFFIKLRPGLGHIQYTGSGSTVGAIHHNSMYLICISDDNTNPPTVETNSRLSFVDN